MRLKKIIEYPDKRVRIIVTVMVSSGIRVGAWDYMKWKHITPLKDKNGNIVAAKLLFYPQDKEEYFYISNRGLHFTKRMDGFLSVTWWKNNQ
jgi:hypothetical protein